MVALALVGCGGGGGTDEEQVQEAVESLINGLADGDGAEACDPLSDQAKQELAFRLLTRLSLEEMGEFLELEPTEQPSEEEFAERIRDACPKAVDELADEAGSKLKELASAEVAEVELEGDRARVELEGSNAAPIVEKVDGEWKITELGVRGG